MASSLYVLCLLGICVLSSTAIPSQTETQKRVVEYARSVAIPASAAAQQQVFDLFANEWTLHYLREFDDGSNLASIDTQQLIDMFWDEINAAELVHSFGEGVSSSANCGFDLSVAQGIQVDTFFNQWQLQALGMTPVDSVNNQFTEWSEVNIFHFPPFQNTSAPDLPTATSRPFYAALNMYRASGGNPQCGPISAILSRSYLHDQILSVPVDTGFYQGSCSNGQATGMMGNTTMVVCSAWQYPWTMGNPPYLSHLLEPYLFYYNESQSIAGNNYPYYSLARLLTRLLSRQTYQSPPLGLQLNFVENSLGYFEFNPAYSISLQSGIKAMVGMYELLWGTELGDQLRLWCIQRAWPLLWAYNPEMSFWRCGADGHAPTCKFPPSLALGIDRANVRLLDLSVLPHSPCGHNMTATHQQTQSFESAWTLVNVTAISRESIHSSWTQLSDSFASDFAVEPVYHHACSSSECVGVRVRDASCVCPEQ